MRKREREERKERERRAKRTRKERETREKGERKERESVERAAALVVAAIMLMYSSKRDFFIRGFVGETLEEKMEIFWADQKIVSQTF